MQGIEQIITSINRDEDYAEAFADIEDLIKDPSTNNTKKPQSKALVEILYKIVSSKSYPPKTKFYAISIAKDFSLKKYMTVVSSLASSALLQEMMTIALTVDPDRRMEEKGLNLFPDKVLGNKFITLVLQCIVTWSNRHPQTQTKSPSKFKLVHNQLIQQRVVLPTKFIYFPSPAGDAARDPKKPQEKKGASSGSGSTPQGNQNTVETVLREGLTKIYGYYMMLDNTTSQEDVEIETRKYHTQFVAQMTRLGSMEAQLGNASEAQVEKYIQVATFYNKENDAYTNFIDGGKRNYEGYLEAMLFDQELEGIRKLAEGSAGGSKGPARKPQTGTDSAPQRGSVPQKQPSSVNPPPAPKKVEQVSYREPAPRGGESSGNNSKINPREEVQYSDNRGGTFGRTDSTGGSQNNQRALEDGIKQINQIFTKSKFTGGFGTIGMELQRQRTNNFSKHSSTSGAGRKRAHTPISGYRSKSRHEQTFNTTVNQSKMSIFDLHTNVEVLRNDYNGTVVPLMMDYASQLEDMSDEQGFKLWKASNFKEKSLLLENESLQIGFKSTPLYQIEGFPALLKIVIFFGNKTEHTITNFEIEYEGDQSNIHLYLSISCQLYSNPRRLESNIEPGYQVKQELIVVPQERVFSLISLRLKYMNNRSISRFHVFLPNTILKFVTYRKISASEFVSNYNRNKSNVYRTSPFLLSRNLPPASLRRYVAEFTELNDYQQFLNQKEYFEYKLACYVRVLNRQDFLIKIRVRPDLTVIIQVCVLEPSSDSVALAKQLLQTWQFMLQRQ